MRCGLLSNAVPTSAGYGLRCAVELGKSLPISSATAAKKVTKHFTPPFLRAINGFTAIVIFGELIKRCSLKRPIVTVRGAPLTELKRSHQTLIKNRTSKPPTGGASLTSMLGFYLSLLDNPINSFRFQFLKLL
jgi:hypothetical protein